MIISETLCDSLADLNVIPSSESSLDALCLGLGSPSSSRDARSQLAFLLGTCDKLNIVCIQLFVSSFAET